MKNLFILIVFASFSINISAQKFITKNGYVSFFGHTHLEDIKADNNQVASILDTSNGELVFQVLMNSFHFERALMEEHFNENYVESEKFPKSIFKGKITNLTEVKFSKSGIYNVNIDGEIEIHGVAKPLSVKGTIEIVKDGIIAKSNFNIKPEDYNITIPGVVREKIAKEMEVTVEMNYSALK